MTENSTNCPVVSVRDLVCDYGKGKNRVRAVDGISFEVRPGETVGFIGANGAGKTTTIKTLMGFQFPASGDVRVFGEKAGTVASRRRIGYLPEVSLYYPYMKARELLELYGGLHEMGRRALKRQIPEVLEQVGLGGRGETLLRNYSKGMQQRLGIAQAIIADPEALILDELSSGLDPVGRFDLRKVLEGLQERGKTIFFSSHELTEVENLCDRVIIIDRGKVIAANPVDELRRPLDRYEVTFQPASTDWDLESILAGVAPADRQGDHYRVEVEGSDRYGEVMQRLTGAGARIVATNSRHQSLEEYFMSLVGGERTTSGKR